MTPTRVCSICGVEKAHIKRDKNVNRKCPEWNYFDEWGQKWTGKRCYRCKKLKASALNRARYAKRKQLNEKPI